MISSVGRARLRHHRPLLRGATHHPTGPVSRTDRVHQPPPCCPPDRCKGKDQRVPAPVRRPDARGDSRGGAAPDPGGDGRPSLGERLALRNWSLPVKLAAVLLVPTLFVITLGVLRIVEQTDKASSY